AGRAGGDQAGLHDRPEEAPRPYPDRHRRCPRGPEPPDSLLEPVPFRRALESEPPRTAQRPYLEAARERQEDLKAQIQRLQNRLEASQDWLALREDHFRSAISCVLQMMHADPLKGFLAYPPEEVYSSGQTARAPSTVRTPSGRKDVSRFIADSSQCRVRTTSRPAAIPATGSV